MPGGEAQNNLNTSNYVSQSGLDPHSAESEFTRLRLFNRSTIKLFKLEEKAASPEAVLTEVLYWTNGQPILTQKLCRLIAESDDFIATGKEAAKVQQLVETRLINNWETQVAMRTFTDNSQQHSQKSAMQTFIAVATVPTNLAAG